jgi:hypothetical protein
MEKKLKMRGILMLMSFFVLLAVIFTPVFPGKVNGLDYMDNLFNMISKGSSYFIPASIAGSEKFAGETIDVKFAMASDKQAADTAKLFQEAGAEATVSGKDLMVKGDLGRILKSSLLDADQMFQNDGAPLTDKYGYPGKEALFNWWSAYKGMEKIFTEQENFKGAKVVGTIRAKALEPAYNYYGVEAGNYKDNLGLIVAALCFYVFYTLWYGFGLMYLFEGLGLKIGH